jgi:hypothetical protein
VAAEAAEPVTTACRRNIEHLHSGIGDWLFRAIAFPDAPDNSAEYFRRFYRGERWAAFREQVHDLRASLGDVCFELITRHRLAEADILGLTSMFAQNGSSIALATLVKERNPNVVTLMGGANCEAPMGTVLANRVPALDCVFSGPALDTFTTFVRCWIDGRLAEVDAVPGLLTSRSCTDPRSRRRPAWSSGRARAGAPPPACRPVGATCTRVRDGRPSLGSRPR